MSTPKYTFYIVSRGRDHHYPVLMANNGKAALNEPVRRAKIVLRSFMRFRDAIMNHEMNVTFIKEADFKKKFPTYAPNKGPKCKAATKKAITQKTKKK